MEIPVVVEMALWSVMVLRQRKISGCSHFCGCGEGNPRGCFALITIKLLVGENGFVRIYSKLNGQDSIIHGEAEKALRKKQKEEKEVLKKFRENVENKLSKFLQDISLRKFEFEPAEKVFRTVIHDAAEAAGILAYTIEEEDIDRRVIICKNSPCEAELVALLRGEEWDTEKAKLLARQRKKD